MAAALGEVGADPSIGDCACLRRELSGEPDVVNLHLRFDEGRAGRATRVAFSPTLPSSNATKSDTSRFWATLNFKAHQTRRDKYTAIPRFPQVTSCHL